MPRIPLSKRVGLNPEEFMKTAIYSDKMQRVTEQILREEYVRELKETFSKRYLLSHNLVTPKEYREINGESSLTRKIRRAAEAASLMNQVVGAEVD